MEIKYFFHTLYQRKWLLLAAMLISGAATFFLVQQLPRKYKSSATLATGIVDYKGILVDKENVFIQQFQIDGKFNNLIEYIKSRPSVKLLSKNLLVHDLSDEKNAFREPELNDTKIDNEDIEKFKQLVLADQADFSDPLHPLFSTFEAREIEKAYEYDYETLIKNFQVVRVGDTDFLRIEFTSEDPQLSHYAVKTYIDEFLKYYYREQGGTEEGSVKFYSHLVESKKNYLDSLKSRLDAYNKNQALVNLEDQGKATVSLLKDLEYEYEQARKNINGYQRAISNLDEETKRYHGEVKIDNFASNVYAKADIQELNRQISALNEVYLDSGFKDEKTKKEIESLKKKREDLTRKYALIPKTKDDVLSAEATQWVKERVKLENDLYVTEASVNSLRQAINEQKRRKSSLVNANAFVGNLVQDVNIAYQEYKEATEKLSEAQLKYQSKEKPLRVIEAAILPDKPEDSNAILLALFAGVAAVTLLTLLIFVLAYFDNTLNNALQFRKFTRLPLMGIINEVPASQTSLDKVFQMNGEDKEMAYFKESLRKIRHIIESSGKQIILFVSPKEQEGKSFLMASLAYSLGIKQKKVLIIDTNFKNNALTQMSTAQVSRQEGEASTGSHSLPYRFFPKLPNVVVIGNKNTPYSPSEVLGASDFSDRLKEFTQTYDYIFLESAAMNTYSDSRELAPFADLIIPVFNAHSHIKADDDESLQYLQSLNGKLIGAILNKADLKHL